MQVAVLVSGSGTILDTFLADAIPVAVVVADRPCVALGKAERAGVRAELVARERFGPSFDRDAYSARLAAVLAGHGVDLVVMAGFGTILSRPMHDAFPARILNTHPALLPKHKGWHAVRDALAAGDTVTGCTIHVAGLEVDTGEVLAQVEVPVLPGDDEATLHERIKAVERPLYSQTLRGVLDGTIPLPTTQET
ncbi:MAG TPA: phosphoribosylglycinamide formyltransferase [Iamia sp.]|nr:phosphoribosylglycinamide formyltransferase [Iamia sp.]